MAHGVESMAYELIDFAHNALRRDLDVCCVSNSPLLCDASQGIRLPTRFARETESYSALSVTNSRP